MKLQLHIDIDMNAMINGLSSVILPHKNVSIATKYGGIACFVEFPLESTSSVLGFEGIIFESREIH